MTLSTLETTPHVQPAEVQALLKTAVRKETPCGTGTIVWHCWGPNADTSTDPKSMPPHAPVLLFHGGSGSWTHWLRNIEPLVAAGRRVLVPDLPGFGDSALPAQGHDADALPEPIEQGLRLLLGNTACDVVGFSFGSMVAGFLAAQFPGRIARLVVVGAPVMGLGPEKALRLKAWRHLTDPDQLDAVHSHNLAAFMLYSPASISVLALRVHAANVVRDRMLRRCLSRTDALGRSLARVQCPVYAIYGREDILYQGKHDELELALQKIQDFRGLNWLDAAGHWVQFERADAFNAALLRCLHEAI